jgi:hypothetical protein
MKNLLFICSSFPLYRPSWTLADMSINSSNQLNVRNERCVNENTEISTTPEPVNINV